MPISRAYVAHETARRMRRSTLHIEEDVRRLRLEAGVSLTELADLVSVHRSHIARIEGGTARPSLEVLTAIGVALGADLSLRYFAGSGPRLHDRFQARMLEAFLEALHARWQVDLEVAINHPARGVIDAVMTDLHSPATVASEVQSQLPRLEQQIRWMSEKADGLAQRIDAHEVSASRQVSRLLILRSTVSTREIARRYRTTLATAYPARTHDIFRALTTPDAPWPGAGILWIRVDGETVSIMEYPPRGVELGR